MLCKGFFLGEDEIRKILKSNGLDTSLESYVHFNKLLLQAMLNVKPKLSILNSSYDENEKVCSVIVGQLVPTCLVFNGDIRMSAYERDDFFNDDLVFKSVNEVLDNLKINEEDVHVGIFEFVE